MSTPVAYLLQSWLNNRGAVVDVIEHCQTTSHVPVGLPPVSAVRSIAA